MRINLKISQLKRIVGANNCCLDDSFFIENISSLENAKNNDIAVLIDRGDRSVFSPVSLENIKKSNAILYLSKDKIVEGKNYLIVNDPAIAFQKIVDFIELNNIEKTNKVKNSYAVVSDSAILQKNVNIEANSVIQDEAYVGENTSIGSNVFIGKKVIIGSNTKIYPGVKILDRCSIGNNCIIHAGAVIGSDGFGYSVTKSGLKKIPQIGIVQIGNDVEIGANCTLDRASFDETIIGNGVKIDNCVHIAHNVKIGDHTVILAQTGIAGGVQIGFGCQIGGQVGIKDHVIIGNEVKIVSKSAVMKNLHDGQIVAGIPAISFSQWKRIIVVLEKLPEVLKDFYKIKIFYENKKKSFLRRFF